jgi:hypothetical protein
MRAHRVRDRLKEILHRNLNQRLLDVSVPNGVERNINGPGLLDHRTNILVNSPLVEGVYDGGVRYAAIRADLVGDYLQLRLGATGEEDPGTLAGKGTGHCTADRTARAVDHGNLVLQ